MIPISFRQKLLPYRSVSDYSRLLSFLYRKQSEKIFGYQICKYINFPLYPSNDYIIIIWIHDTVAINFLVIKQRFIDIYKQTWYTRLCNSNRLSSYVKYKTEFKMENTSKYLCRKIQISTYKIFIIFT